MRKENLKSTYCQILQNRNAFSKCEHLSNSESCACYSCPRAHGILLNSSWEFWLARGDRAAYCSQYIVSSQALLQATHRESRAQHTRITNRCPGPASLRSTCSSISRLTQRSEGCNQKDAFSTLCSFRAHRNICHTLYLSYSIAEYISIEHLDKKDTAR